MVYEPLGFANTVNVMGIILELIGFILLLTQFQKKLIDIAEKLGDSKRQIIDLNNLVIRWGIYFVIGGLVMQFLSVMLDSYFPNLYDDLEIPAESIWISLIIFVGGVVGIIIYVVIKYKKISKQNNGTQKQSKKNRIFVLLLIALLIGSVIGLVFGIIIGISFNSNALEQKIEDKGDFHVEVKKPTNSSYQMHYETFLKEEHNLETFLNAQFNFPYDITLLIEDCKDTDPDYNNQLHQIEICYVFLDEVIQHFGEYSEIDDKSKIELINGTIVFSLYHEIAHALIDIFELPIVGNEEIAADQFATILLLPQIVQEGGISLYLSGPAQFFYIEMEQYKTINDIPFTKLHPIGEQRSANIVCLAYGKLDSKPFKEAKLETLIDYERLSNCKNEFINVSQNWKELLENHLKPDSLLSKDYLTSSYYDSLGN